MVIQQSQRVTPCGLCFKVPFEVNLPQVVWSFMFKAPPRGGCFAGERVYQCMTVQNIGNRTMSRYIGITGRNQTSPDFTPTLYRVFPAKLDYSLLE